MEEQQEQTLPKEHIESLIELSKFYKYNSRVMQTMYQNNEVAETRVYFMGEPAPQEFIRFSVDGQTLSNDNFCTFAVNVIVTRQKNSDTWIIVPFSFNEKAIFTLNQDKIRATSGLWFEQKINAFQPKTHTLYQTSRLTLLQVIRNIFMFPLSTIRGIKDSLASRHL